MGGEEKNRVTVEIFGMQYRLVAESSPTYLKEIASLLDVRMREIAERNPKLDLPRVAVLAALRTMDDCFRLERKAEALERLARESEQRMREQAAALSEEAERLRAERDRLAVRVRELEEEVGQLRSTSCDPSIAEAYRKLQEEYAKLQAEYNEWIRFLEES